MRNGCYRGAMGRWMPPPTLDCEAGHDPSSQCPACHARLDGRSTPPGSVVICAQCCTPLLWETRFSRLTADQLRALPAIERERLCAVVALQRARLCTMRLN